MAIMKPIEVDIFQNDSEKKAYELLKNIDDTYTVIYEPSIGLQKKRTPDFIILSQKFGLIVLDVKYVKLENIKESNPQIITKTNGVKMKNFHQIVKDYAYTVNNQLVKELKENATIVHPNNSKMAGRLTFPHSSGLLLFLENEGKYTKEDVAQILSLNETDFLIVNKIQNIQDELQNFIVNLNRPFVKGLTSSMQGEILKKIYIDSDASSNEFINTMSQFNLPLNKNFKKELSGTHFEKSKQLKKNLLAYATFSQNSIDVANKNLGLGCENIIEKLKGYKQELEEEKFTVAVFGYFNTGKSTFLNALMGTDKLPMEEDRATATFTRLRHCDESEDFNDGDMQVVYKDENDIAIAYKEAIDKLNFSDDEEKKYLKYSELKSFKDELLKRLKEIKIRDYNSEQRDDIKNAKKTLGFILDNNIPYGTTDKVAKEDINEFLTDDKKAFGISEVIYYLDNDLLKDIEIVDTPGYGSENTMDTFKTQEFVKEANVLILLTESKDPMSKSDEHNFLETYEDIYKKEDGGVNTNNLFVIANKVDESTKSIQKIKDSIKTKIEDNWEDSLILKDEQIFTMSAKYHYDKIHTKLYSENINEDDLTDFIESYSIFLTKNKDKEIIKNSFKNIDDTVNELHEIFNKILLNMNSNIADIKQKKELFQKNKEEISKTYNLFGQSLSANIKILHDKAKQKLDKQKFKDEESTVDAYTRYLKNKGLTSQSANKKNAKEFYVKLTKAIQKDLLKENNSLFTNTLKENMDFINKKIEQLSIKLEEEYNISGLEKEISVQDFNIQKVNTIEFEKSFVRIVLDVILFGRADYTSYYAKQMNEDWSENTYSLILKNIDNSNNLSITKIQDEFKAQSLDIVNSIENKLNDIEKNIRKRQKDREEYNKKTTLMESTFEKINKLKTIIKKQESSLYS